MTFAQRICAPALLVSTAAGANAAASAFPAKPKAPAVARVSSAVRLEYTDFSKLYGDRAVLSADSRVGIGQSTRFSLSLSEGQRRGTATRTRSTQGAVAVDHDWSDRLSSRTTAALASNGRVFAKAQLGQDISYKIAGGLVGTVGAKYSSYGDRNDVAAWSAGAAYYLRGATLSYRYSLLASNRFGRSHAHLASLRVKDPGGSGATQLWAGQGTSLYEVELPRNANGRFTSIALQRSQPIGGGIALDVGVNRAWYETPRGKYRGTGLIAGLSFANWPL
jgi:YaiO family outer membrane protein